MMISAALADRLRARGADLAAVAVARNAAALADRLGAAWPDVALAAGPDGLVLAGRDLLARRYGRAADARLLDWGQMQRKIGQ